MELQAKSEAKSSVPFASSTPSFQAQAMTDFLLDTFESELDALLDFLSHERNAATSEALIRRFATAEEVYKDLEKSYGRIQLKMMMLSDKLAEKF